MEWDDIRNGAIWAPAIAAGLVVAWFTYLWLREWWAKRARRKRPTIILRPSAPESESSQFE